MDRISFLNQGIYPGTTRIKSRFGFDFENISGEAIDQIFHKSVLPSSFLHFKPKGGSESHFRSNSPSYSPYKRQNSKKSADFMTEPGNEDASQLNMDYELQINKMITEGMIKAIEQDVEQDELVSSELSRILSA